MTEHDPPLILEHHEFAFSAPLVDARVGTLETLDALELAPWIDAMRGQTTTEPRPTRHTFMTDEQPKPTQPRMTFNGSEIVPDTEQYLITSVEGWDAPSEQPVPTNLGSLERDPLLCRIRLHRWTPWQPDGEIPDAETRACERCLTWQVRPAR